MNEILQTRSFDFLSFLEDFKKTIQTPQDIPKDSTILEEVETNIQGEKIKLKELGKLSLKLDLEKLTKEVENIFINSDEATKNIVLANLEDIVSYYKQEELKRKDEEEQKLQDESENAKKRNIQTIKVVEKFSQMIEKALGIFKRKN